MASTPEHQGHDGEDEGTAEANEAGKAYPYILSRLKEITGISKNARVRDAPASRWIAPPELPDEAARAKLCATLAKLPRVAEAWAVGTRLTVADGSTTDETNIALVLNPFPRDDERNRETLDAFAVLYAERGPREPQRWLFVNRDELVARGKNAVRIYSRGDDSAE